MSEEIKSWDDVEDQNLVSKIVTSQEFKDSITKSIVDATWGKGLPMVYMNRDGWIVKHWEDGTIKRIKKIKI